MGSTGLFRSNLLEDISIAQIKAKVNKLKLVLVPKKERLCIQCKIGNQFRREAGLLCRKCYLAKRKDVRSSHLYTFEEWLKEMARNCRYRSQKFHGIESDITIDFLKELWDKQNGKCFYSTTPMLIPQFKRLRNPYSASLDRKDSSRGYTKDNVVWCCWGCNCAKSNFTLQDYLAMCEKIVENKTNILK